MTSSFNPLFVLLVCIFSGVLGAYIHLAPNPGPNMLQVIEIDMDSPPPESSRNIPRPRHRQTDLQPVDAQPIQAATAPPTPKAIEPSVPKAPPSVPSLAGVQDVHLPSSDAASFSGVSTSATAAATGFLTEKDYFQLVKMRIQALKAYPEKAKKRHQQRLVVIQFHLEKKGRGSTVRVHENSGNRILDQAAVQAVHKAAPFPQAPQGMFDYPIRLQIGVAFELT